MRAWRRSATPVAPPLLQTRLRAVVQPSLLVTLGWLGASTSGCSPAATDGVFPDQDVALAATNDGGTADGAAAASGLTGQWAMVAEWSTCVTVIDEIETRAWRLLKVDTVHAANGLHEIRTLCELRLTPILGLATIVPQPLIDAHPQMKVESFVLGGDEVGAVYQGGPEVQRFGINLTSPLTEAMPTKEQTDDPRLEDSENDGKPGATFTVGPSCAIHIAQREVSGLQGTIVAKGRIEGGGIHQTEQVVFGSTKAICGQSFSTRANDGHNRFVMIRAEGFDDDGDGNVTCAELRAHGDEIAPQSKANDASCVAP